MEQPIKLVSIPDGKYSDYRYEVIFKAYKWDPQVEDQNTISKHVAIMSKKTAEELMTWAEQLSAETILMEEKLIKRPSLANELGLPKGVIKALDRLSTYDRDKNVRLMRFDFHFTETGVAVSEVNSDVPGGFAEASVLPEIAAKYFEGCEPCKNAASGLLNAFKAKLGADRLIAFVHATSYADDRQVMQFLSDYFNKNGFNTIFNAPDHVKWVDKKAHSILHGSEGALGGIIRFFPLEWLVNLPHKSNWKGYYDSETTSCNHPVAIFAQSKRLPLIWDKLDVEIPAWKALLPATRSPKLLKQRDDNWIYKPALGRVGEGISIKGTVSEKEIIQIEKAAHKQPGDWIAQQMFKSRSIDGYHLCIGVFTIDGKSAGFYGRISPYPLIDAKAKDIPVLISKDGIKDEG